MSIYSLRWNVSRQREYEFKKKTLSLSYALLHGHQFEEQKKKKSKVVYGHEPPSGESTTTECGFNYQLLAVITEVAPSCSQPQPATDNGVRDGRSN